jgi:hypothetical protein
MQRIGNYTGIGSGHNMNEGESYANLEKPSFVFYTLSMNGQQSQISTIKVNEGDDIDSIKRGIKVDNSNLCASVPAYRLEAFISIDEEEPLDSLEKWTKTVTWGTPETPLIVKIPMTNINSGKCAGLCEWFVRPFTIIISFLTL